FVEGADAGGGELHGAAHLFRKAGQGVRARVVAYDEVRGAAAEPGVVTLNRLVALGADGGEDLADGRLDPLEIALPAGLQALQRRFELGRTLHERREHGRTSVASHRMRRSAAMRLAGLPAVFALAPMALLS